MTSVSLRFSHRVRASTANRARVAMMVMPGVPSTVPKTGSPLAEVPPPTIPSAEWFAQMQAVAERAEATRTSGAEGSDNEPPPSKPEEARK
jgi:hypothetical protein